MPFGLYRSDHTPKPAAAAYMKVAGPIVEPPETPVSIQKAIDVSSHQPRDLSGLIAQFRPDHVIVKGYLPGESISQDHTRAQVRSARNNGCTVGMYVWCYRSFDPIRTIDDIIALCASIDLVLPLLWLDCETYGDPVTDPGPDAEWLARAVEHAENTYGMACGVYTGLWWIRGHFPGGEWGFQDFARLPIWLSDYDNHPDINDVTLPQGWAEAAAKQYSATPIDQDVIRSRYTVYGAEPPPPDPCEHLHRQLEAWRNRKPYKAITKKQLTALLTGA